GNARASLPCEEAKDIGAIAFSSDGRTLACAGRGCVTLWEVATGRVRLKVPCPEKWPSSVGLASTNRLVTVRTRMHYPRLQRPDISRVESLLRVVTATGETGFEWKLDGLIHAAVWAPDGRHVMVPHESGTVYILRIPN